MVEDFISWDQLFDEAEADAAALMDPIDKLTQSITSIFEQYRNSGGKS
jgi:hypothetical protein